MKRHASLSVSPIESDYENEYTDLSDDEYLETPKNCLLLKYDGKYLSWNSEKMKSCCTAGSNLRLYAFIGQINKKLKPEVVLVTPAMMGYKFPLPLAKLLQVLCLLPYAIIPSSSFLQTCQIVIECF